MNKNDIGAIILSGGYSTRMGSPKAFLELNNNFLVNILSDIYRNFGIKKPIIVLNKYLFDTNWSKQIQSLSTENSIIKNDMPELGRSYSIQLGLNELKNKKIIFIQNIDNPDINISLLNKLVTSINNENYVTPTNKGCSGHPILISQTIVTHLKKIEHSEWILKDELKKFNQTKVEVTNNVQLNINTKMEWENYVNRVNKKSVQYI